MELKREHHINIWYIVLAVLAVLSIHDWLGLRADVEILPYSRFQDLLHQGQLDDLVVGTDHITGRLKNAPAGKPAHFSTVRVDPAIADSLAAAKVSFSGEPGPGLLASVLGWFAPTLVFLLLWFWLIRPMGAGGMGSGLMSVGRSRAKIYVESDVGVKFDDVAGVDEAKEELKEVVEFLQAPEKYGRLGAHIPKGVLLVGPPGTGKTLLARAVAGEAKVPFFSISGSEFVEMFVGVGAARVRDLFEQARAKAPAIIFIDEIDSLGRARTGFMPGGGHDEKEQTLNQLLAELDGFDPTSGIVLLGATNRPETLDPALLRPGRFDRQVLVDRPDKKGRIDILKIYIRKIKLAPEVSVERVAALTPGFTGADLANLVNEAAIVATRRGGDLVTEPDFVQAIERIVAGLEKRNRLLNPHERDVVAHHELGHAIVSMALPGTDKVQKISIIPRGIGALGYTLQRPTEDRFLMDRSELIDRMTVLLGGRAAESLIFPEVSTGAADDLARATDIARSMVARFGMDKTLGQVAYEPEHQRMLGAPPGMDWEPRHFGESTASAIDGAIRSLIEEAFGRARAILGENLALLKETAVVLLQKETLAGADLDALSGRVRGSADLRAPPAAAQ